MVGEVDGVCAMVNWDGCEGPMCWNGHVVGRALSCCRMVRHLGSKCLASCWSHW